MKLNHHLRLTYLKLIRLVILVNRERKRKLLECPVRDFELVYQNINVRIIRSCKNCYRRKTANDN